mmetsp:Transcript_25385/g.74723  ORF Transcript_25385/g.74723 Transcript_25385/m.74723 type:complete len:152 (-) Transcript_25385:540-995(-)
MNMLILSLGDAENHLLGECQAFEVSAKPALRTARNDTVQNSSCEQAVAEIMAKGREDVTTMRDIDIETDIIILFGRYWRPTACMGGTAFGAPAYGRDECFGVDQNVTIHGIWPSSRNVRSFINPVNCSDPFDLKLEDINDEMESDFNKDWV